MQNSVTTKELEAVKVMRGYLVKYGRIPSVRELMKDLNYKSPRSVSIIIQSLQNKGILSKKEDGRYQLKDFEVSENYGDRAQTVKIPLLGTVACGVPIFAEENIEAEIQVSVNLIKAPHKYFLLRASGDSMNKSGILDGNLVLIRQQQAAENGDNVVALIDEEATIKEYRNNGNTVVLSPHSTNSRHQPIILTSEFRIQGVVVAIIPI
jgi:repressor LexA